MFFEDTCVKQEVLMKPVRSLPQVIGMLRCNRKRLVAIDGKKFLSFHSSK